MEILVRKDLLQVADRNTGPLATIPNIASGPDYDRLTEYLKQVKSKYPEKTDASILLEPDTNYDTVVQVMDHTRVFEAKDMDGIQTVQAELFLVMWMGDAGAADAPRSAGAPL